jgi:hypothetical protein
MAEYDPLAETARLTEPRDQLLVAGGRMGALSEAINALNDLARDATDAEGAAYRDMLKAMRLLFREACDDYVRLARAFFGASDG